MTGASGPASRQPLRQAHPRPAALRLRAQARAAGEDPFNSGFAVLEEAAAPLTDR
jgi:hypothetical protein